MTKYMILKSFIALLLITGFSCAKKSERKVTPQAPILEKQTSEEKNKLDLSKKESSGSSAPSSIDVTKVKEILPGPITKTTTETKTVVVTQKSSADETKAQAGAPVLDGQKSPAAEIVSSDLTKKQSAEVQSQDETKAQIKDQVQQISEEEKSAVLKIKVLNLKKIVELLNQSKKVVFKSKVIDADQAMKELKKGNEDSFCSLAGDIAFASGGSIAIALNHGYHIVNNILRKRGKIFSFTEKFSN